jgi:hypothetical protein
MPRILRKFVFDPDKSLGVGGTVSLFGVGGTVSLFGVGGTQRQFRDDASFGCNSRLVMRLRFRAASGW